MARQGSLAFRFRQFDAYAKTLDDFRVKTTAGATVTVISALIIVYLVMSELIAYRTPIWRPELIVDKGRKEKMNIHFNVTFPKMPCHMLSLDIMDDSGEHISGYTHDIYKVRLDRMGVPIHTEKTNKLGDTSEGAALALQNDQDTCGSCYGAQSVRDDGCCNTCDEVRQAYANSGWGIQNEDNFEQCVREGWKARIAKQADEGCNVHGQLSVNKVRGNFHIAPGQSFQNANMHVHDLKSFFQGAPDGHAFDLSHEIHLLRFGPDPATLRTSKKLKGDPTAAVTNALAGTAKTATRSRTVYQYFLKIVSTQLEPLSGTPVYTNQYSVTQNERVLDEHAGGLPGVFFIMDISPMLITYREERSSFASFLTGVCAIIGGIFTVAGLFDRVVYRAERSLKKKMDLGKTL